MNTQRRVATAGLSIALIAQCIVGWLGGAALVLAALPTATPTTGGDPRSSGQGPGLVGDPLAAIVGVLALALVALLLTTAYVRLTATRKGSPGQS